MCSLCKIPRCACYGLHRYADDSYYGGGAWILLTAWLGSYYIDLATKRPDLAAGLQQKIHAYQSWIESSAGNNLNLPEQGAEPKCSIPLFNLGGTLGRYSLPIAMVTCQIYYSDIKNQSLRIFIGQVAVCNPD